MNAVSDNFSQLACERIMSWDLKRHVIAFVPTGEGVQ
jgi:hypothetical protein